MIKLRPYQTEAISQLRNGFAKNKRQVLCLPTGSGKTIVFSEIVRMAAEKGTRCLILTDRIELFTQTFNSLKRADLNPQIIHAGNKNISELATVNVAMVETIDRRIKKGFKLEPGLIIIDEAHKGNFNKIIDLFPGVKVIGCTATPLGKHFYKYYTDIVQNIEIPELIEQGYLCNYKAFQMVDDFSDLEEKRGEFTDQSLFTHFNKTSLYSGVVQEWKQRTPDSKTIVFNVNIKHAEQMTEEFRKNGIESHCISSKTSKEDREQILTAFKNGLFPVLNNCGILTTGYDEPSIETVILNRATKSLPLFLQMCGRGSRLHTNKEFFTVLDFGMNHDRFGLWSEPRNWELKPPKKKKEMAAPIKKCTNCEALIPASTRICPYCQTEMKVAASEPKEGVMVEFTEMVYAPLRGKKISSLSLQELISLEKSKKYKSSYIWRVLRGNGTEWVKQYAEIKGYKQGWVKRQLQDIENSNFTDYLLK